MSKAEKMAMQYCCAKCANNKRNCGMKLISHGRNCIACSNYIEGYHQAEKDLELTWTDMECIIKHYQDIMAEKSRVFVRVEDYQELLKRFKKLKENNEKKIETHGENYMTILR